MCLQCVIADNVINIIIYWCFFDYTIDTINVFVYFLIFFKKKVTISNMKWKTVFVIISKIFYSKKWYYNIQDTSERCSVTTCLTILISYRHEIIASPGLIIHTAHAKSSTEDGSSSYVPEHVPAVFRSFPYLKSSNASWPEASSFSVWTAPPASFLLLV